ncbi:7703_t:CDS:2 [Cetraspora pellucida]|uniref:7703_t:CDS:1 n=1 Tax=Cetraspora pellucida TaxID=1433469 RepID=A0ACA9KDD9_9GLOM|nr:7703_t:CDS:2 [Cetraspora pellucida]
MDERRWAKLTVDSFIEVISNDIHEKMSVAWGDDVDQATKNCKTVTINQKITKKTTLKLEEKSYRERLDSRICWSDEETAVTLAYCEIAGPPFNIIDELKWESDRRKLIKMGKNCTRNMIKDFKQAHNKYLSEDIIIQIRSQPRILFLVYGTYLKILYYDESYFPFGRIRVLMDQQIPYKKNSSNTLSFVKSLLSVRQILINWKTLLIKWKKEISNNRMLQVTYGGIKQEDCLPAIKSPSKAHLCIKAWQNVYLILRNGDVKVTQNIRDILHL